MSKRNDVGYMRPPTEHRFPTGVSGNPSGRRRKHRPPEDEGEGNFVWRTVISELKRKVPVVEGGKRKRVTLLQLLIRRHVQDSINGDATSRVALIKVVAQGARELPHGPDNKQTIVVINGLPDDDHYVSEEEMAQHMMEDSDVPSPAAIVALANTQDSGEGET